MTELKFKNENNYYLSDISFEQLNRAFRKLGGGIMPEQLSELKEFLKKEHNIDITRKGIIPEQYEELNELVKKECNIDLNRITLGHEDIMELRIHPENYRFWNIPDDIKQSMAEAYYADVIYDYLKEHNLPTDSFGLLTKDSITKEFVQGFFFAVNILKHND